MGGDWTNFEKHDRENLNFPEEMVSKNLDFMTLLSEVSEENEHVGNWRKGDT